MESRGIGWKSQAGHGMVAGGRLRERRFRVTIRVVKSGWEKEMRDALASAGGGELRIICPFIQLDALEPFLVQELGVIQVITRFKGDDFAAGVSDVEALRKLLEVGAQVRGIRDLHAKLYLFGSTRAIVTSANLTGLGLKSNHEFGVVAEEESFVRACQEYFADLWERGGDDLVPELLDRCDADVARYKKTHGGNSRKIELPDYGVDIGVVGTPPAQPSVAPAEAPQARGEWADTGEMCWAYWSALLDVLKELNETGNPVSGDLAPRSDSMINFAIGKHGFFVSAQIFVKNPKIKSQIYIYENNVEKFYLSLQKQRKGIERELGYALKWEKQRKTRRIAIYLGDANPYDKGDWPRQHEWLARKLNDLHRVFAPRIKRLNPAGWVGERKNVTGTALKEMQRNYWDAFFGVLAEKGSSLSGKGRIQSSPSWVKYSVLSKGCHLAVGMNTKVGSVHAELYNESGNAKRAFDFLRGQGELIERELGYALEWERESQENPKRKKIRIFVRHDFDLRDREVWSQQHAWLAEKLVDLHRVFHDRVRDWGRV